MTEVLENIVAAYYEIKGYFTKTRVPVGIKERCKIIEELERSGNKKAKKGISDIDIIAYKRDKDELIMIECKGWGSPEKYGHFNSPKKIEMLARVIIKRLCVWDNYANNSKEFNYNELKKFVIIIPGAIREESKNDVKKRVIDKIRQNPLLRKYVDARRNTLKVEIDIKPIHELILGLVEEVKRDMVIRRKRYQNEALELIRWLIKIEATFNKSKQESFLEGIKKIILN